MKLLATVKPTFLKLIVAAASAVILSGCATTVTPSNLADTIATQPNLSTLSRLVAQSGMADSLKAAGPYTVFAPSNEAFGALPAKTLESLNKDPSMLKNVLSFHVLTNKTLSSEIQQGNVKSLQGANLALAKAGAYVTVEEALVTTADLQATNGVIHVIDKVLLPPASK